MAGEIFQPQVAQINSAVQPEQGVADTSAVDLFTDVAKVATQAAFAFTGQQELTDLGNKFSRVVEAREQGGSSSALQIKARADLDEAKANSPWIAKQADKLFRDAFGGSSGTGGIFKNTPQEEARDKHTQRLEETRLALGLSTVEEAQKRISLDENAKSAKVQADAQKDVREYNGELIFSNTQAQLNNNSIKFMDATTRAMSLSGGTLKSDDVRSLNLAVDQQALTLKQQLNSQTRDNESGHLLIDKAGYDANLKEIEDWVANSKAMINDNSTLQVVQKLNTEQTAEINFLATNKYRTIAEINVVAGQAGVQAYFAAALTKNPVSRDLIIQNNPILREMFRQSGSFNQASSTGFDKLILPTPTVSIMNQPEAMSVGTQLNDPANAKLMEVIVDKVAVDATSEQAYTSMIQQNPDSSALTWSQRFKAWSLQNPDKGTKVLGSTVDGLKKAFLTSYVSDNGSFPSDFTVKIAVAKSKGRTGGAGLSAEGIGRNSVDGAGISQATASVAFNMYNVFSKNPMYLRQVSTEAGALLSPEEAVKFVILGVTPEPLDLGQVKDETE